jgi:putative FmdB family regulatory protein
MPLFDFLCLECGRVSETLLTGASEAPACVACGSRKLKRLLSAPSSLSGVSRNSLPGPGDTACCGSTPALAAGCAGPGSCCGHRH